MPTKTKRPLKKGDKCWIRIQRKGAPVLAVYDKDLERGLHMVYVGEEVFITIFLKYFMYSSWEAIFVAKPIPPEAQNVDQVGKKNDSGGRTNEDSR